MIIKGVSKERESFLTKYAGTPSGVLVTLGFSLFIECKISERDISSSKTTWAQLFFKRQSLYEESATCIVMEPSVVPAII